MNAESTEGVWAPFVLDAVVFNRQKVWVFTFSSGMDFLHGE